jgi:HlyD family secretion protein
MSRGVARLWRVAQPAAEEEARLSLMDREVHSTAPIRRRLAIAVAAVILVAAAIAGYVHFGLSRTMEVRADRVVIASVAPGVFDEYVPANALIVPRTTAFLDAIEGGQVAEVLVEEGAFVERGQPLVRLKNTNLQLEVLGRQAQLMEQLDRLNSTVLSFEQARLGHERELIEAGAQIAQLSQRLRRREALRTSGAVSESDLDELRIDLARYQKLEVTMKEAQAVDRKFQSEQITQLRSALAATRDNLAMAGETLQGLSVTAPISGQLTALDAHLGEAKAAGQRIGQIDDTHAYKIEAEVDEFYLPRVRAGQVASTEFDGNRYALEVIKVYPQVRERQFKVDLLFADATPPALRRGQSLQVRLEVGASRQSLMTSNGPFYQDTGGKWVYVLSKSGTEAQRRTVSFGRRNPEKIEVLAGLVPGERIITSSYETLRGADRIRFRDGGD